MGEYLIFCIYIFAILFYFLYVCIMSKKMEYNEFIGLARKVHGNKYIYDDDTESKFNGSHSVIPITCPIHGKFNVVARNHLKYGCRKCSYVERGLNMRSNTESFIEKARKIHGEKYDYSKVIYKTAKNDDVCITCPIHGDFLMKPNYHLSGEGCPKCKDSHLERLLSNAFDENGIIYTRKKHFDWLGRQEIDFFIDEIGIGIECQGKQHLGLGGWTDSFDFEKLFSLDKLKNTLCRDNEIRLLYLIDPLFYKHSKKIKIYNDDNTFYDVDKLVEYVKENQ